MNAVVIRERVMPRENGRLDGLAGSMVEYVIDYLGAILPILGSYFFVFSPL
jgi:hypothetical protein